jgi:hypothetical protein
MATVPVRFEFMCDKETLKYMHNVPRSLVNANPAAVQANLEYQNNFVSTVKPIVAEHYAAALAACQDGCCVCDAPKTQANLSPISFLHVAQDPFVTVMAAPVCEKGNCEIEARQQVQKLMRDMASGVAGSTVSASTSSGPIELKFCRVCGSLEGAKKCAKCAAVYYCSREHQAADWPTHKQACKSVAST